MIVKRKEKWETWKERKKLGRKKCETGKKEWGNEKLETKEEAGESKGEGKLERVKRVALPRKEKVEKE